MAANKTFADQTGWRLCCSSIHKNKTDFLMMWFNYYIKDVSVKRKLTPFRKKVETIHKQTRIPYFQHSDFLDVYYLFLRNKKAFDEEISLLNLCLY